MVPRLQIVLMVGIVIYFIIVVRLLKSKRLSLKYTLLWLAIGILLLVLAAFPDLLSVFSKLFGFQSSMNALFVFTIGFAFVLLMALTSIDSKQTDRIKNLIQENALLEKRVRILEEQLKTSNPNTDDSKDGSEN